jgi:glycosyltransferase involved in cell wall biosynthesis
MKRLAIFTEGDIRTLGGNRYIIELANKLRGFNVTIFSQESKHNLRLTKAQVEKMTSARVRYYKAIEPKGFFERIPLTSSALKVFRGLNDFDTVYCMDPSIVTNYMLSRYCRKYGTKLVFGIHDPGVLAGRPMKGTIFRKAIWPAYSMAQNSMINRIGDIHVINNERIKALKYINYKGNVHYIPNYIYNEVNPKSLTLNNKEFIVLFVGRLAVQDKGIDILAEVVKRLMAKTDSIKFHIVGSGEDGGHIIKALKKEYPKNIKWFNRFIGSEELAKEQRAASVYLLTSRWESMPATLLEAQSFGLPAISSDIAGTRDIIEEKMQGVLVNTLDIDGFVDALLQYYKIWHSDKTKMLKYKKEISRLIDSKHGEKVILPRLERMLA